jgi:cellulose synthase/poly-beta-1,6-N-acetylglucosamine synthase-like glycosyltransferase/peptidoglycan/xylan/chitin deacetylase (PgdA/CDA1 family)/spore germination protein YaaH
MEPDDPSGTRKEHAQKYVFEDPAGRRWWRVRVAFVLLFLMFVVAGALFFYAVWTPPAVLGRSPLRVAQQELRAERAAALLAAPISRKDWQHLPPYSAKGKKRDPLPASEAKPIRAAFFASWDPAAWPALRAHANQFDVLIAEWMSLLDVEGALRIEADEDLEAFLGETDLKLVLLLNNLEGDNWRPEAVEELARSPQEMRRAWAAKVVAEAKRVKAAGVAVDWQETDPTVKDGLTKLFEDLRDLLHGADKELWVVISAGPGSRGLDVDALIEVADRCVAVLHDENAELDEPGPVASQDWFEGWLNALVVRGVPEKWILAVGNYGYVWPTGGGVGRMITFADAMELARRTDVSELPIREPELNPVFAFSDTLGDQVVWFLDAVTWWNQTRWFADYHLGGIALYRLGTEDPGIWDIPWLRPSSAPPSPAEKAVLERLRPSGHVGHLGRGDFITADPEEAEGIRSIAYDPSGRVTSSYVKLPQFASVSHGPVFATNPHFVALTFDDGPDPRWTPRILDVLKERKVKATFFVVGRQAERYPEILTRMVAESHLLGNHSFFHPNLGNLTEAHARLELTASTRLLESLTGRTPLLFRPPYLRDSLPATKQELAPILAAQSLNMLTVGQTMDPRDYERPGTEELVRRVKEQRVNGQILLMHDGGGDRSQTVEALPEILRWLDVRGDVVVPLPALVGLEEKEVMPPVASQDLAEVATSGWGFRIWRLLETGAWWLVMASTGLVLIRACVITVLAIRWRPPKEVGPAPASATVIVPAHNESKVIAATLDSLVRQEGIRDLEIIVVDDGSNDGTAATARAFAATHFQVRVIEQRNAGKASALNRGLDLARHEVVVMLDADTQFEPSTVAKLLSGFGNPRTGAVSGQVRVGNPRTALTRWQELEYLFGFNLERRACDTLQGIMVVPGAVGAWRKAAITAVGGVPENTLAEDTDLTLAIQRAGWQVRHHPRAVAWTEAPENVRDLFKQRFRWTFGTMQALWKHRSLWWSRDHPGLGFFSVPGTWFFHVFLTALGPFMDLGLVLAWLGGAGGIALLAFLVFIGVELSLTLLACALDGAPWRFALRILPMRVVYRPLLSLVVWRSLGAVLRGAAYAWGRAHRTASVPTRL